MVGAKVETATAGELRVPGSGAWSLPFEVPAYKAGQTTVYDALLVDPEAGTKTVRTNELRITYGP